VRKGEAVGVRLLAEGGDALERLEPRAVEVFFKL
jgi:hypothetical protein